MLRNQKPHDEKILGSYTSYLIAAISKRLEEYYKRIDLNPRREHTHVKPIDALKDAGHTGLEAAAVGQAFPILGPAICGFGGVTYSFFSSAVKEAKNCDANNKIDNADKILKSLNYRKEDNSHHIDQTIIEEASKKIILERSNMLLRLAPSPNHFEVVSDYLAAHALSALKDNTSSSKSPVEVIVDGVQMTPSKKVSSIALKTLDDHKLSLQEIAENAVSIVDFVCDLERSTP